MKKTRGRGQSPSKTPSSPLLIVLSGPSGVGKDTVLTRLRASAYPLKFITTVTTRQQRAREKDNLDYHFISTEQFQEMLTRNELLEWANVYGNFYGVPKHPVKQALEKGQDTIVKVDVQGAANIRKVLPQAVFIFLMPPSIEELIARLGQRHTESPFDLDLRIQTAEEEVRQLPLFDYVVTNGQDEVELAVSKIKAIITAEKCRVIPREITL